MRVIILSLIFLIINIENYASPGETTIKKNARITLLPSNKVKLENWFYLPANTKFRIKSDELNGFGILENVQVVINGEKLADSLFTAEFKIFKKDGLNIDAKYHPAEISLNKILSNNHFFELYMSFQVSIIHSDRNFFEIVFAETNLKSEKPLNVLYNLEIICGNRDFRVDLSNYNSILKNVIEHNSRKISGYKNYKCNPLNNPWKMDLIQGISFTKINSNPLRELEKTITLINLSNASEEVSYKFNNVEGFHLLTYEDHFYHVDNLIEAPSINLNIDGKELIPQRVNEDKISELDWDLLLRNDANIELPKFLYYFGKHRSRNGNILIVSFKLGNKSLANLIFGIKYDVRSLIETTDGINFHFNYPIGPFVEKRSDFYQYLNLKLPQDYYFSALDDSLKGIVNNETLSFQQIGNEYFDFSELKIPFHRSEKPNLLLIRTINIVLGITSIGFLIFYIIKPMKVKNFIETVNFKIFIEWFLIAIGYLYGFSTLFFAQEIFWDAFRYTYSFIPILISTFIFYSIRKGRLVKN